MITLFESRSSSAVSTALIGRHFTGRLRTCGGWRRAAARAEAAGDDADEIAVHRAAHDVGQDRARRADERAGDDQQVVREHEARRRRGPARVAVEHGDHDRHVGAADRHHHVDAEQQRNHRHHDERHHSRTDVVRVQELHAEEDHAEQPREIEPVARRQQQRLAADLARSACRTRSANPRTSRRRSGCRCRSRLRGWSSRPPSGTPSTCRRSWRSRPGTPRGRRGCASARPVPASASSALSSPRTGRSIRPPAARRRCTGMPASVTRGPNTVASTAIVMPTMP